MIDQRFLAPSLSFSVRCSHCALLVSFFTFLCRHEYCCRAAHSIRLLSTCSHCRRRCAAPTKVVAKIVGRKKSMHRVSIKRINSTICICRCNSHYVVCTSSAALLNWSGGTFVHSIRFLYGRAHFAIVYTFIPRHGHAISNSMHG